MSSTDETDKIEIFKAIMNDEKALNLLRDILKMKDEYGENGDNFISYILGAIASFFSKSENAIACLESVKFGLIMRGMQVSTTIVADELRQKQPSKLKPI